MATDNLKSIIDCLQSQGEMSFCEGASVEQINAFEQKNSISLPNQYKQWLQFSDGGECFLPASVQFYGIAHKPIVDVNDDNRPNDNYIVIGALASGDPILCEKSNEQISIFNHSAGRIEDDESYPDFFSFLNDLNEILGIGG